MLLMTTQAAFSSTYSSFGRADYHPNIVVQLRRDLTDLLPMDLEAHFEPGDYTFKFNWRTYLCTYFDETRSMSDEPAEEDVEDVRKQFPEGMDNLGVEGFRRMLALVYKKMQSKKFEVRRKRRIRIGLKTQEWLREESPDTLDWFSKLEERQMERRKGNYNMAVSFVEFSDSEEEEEGGGLEKPGREVEGGFTEDDSDEDDEYYGHEEGNNDAVEEWTEEEDDDDEGDEVGEHNEDTSQRDAGV
jgi:hypothetical protein